MLVKNTINKLYLITESPTEYDLLKPYVGLIPELEIWDVHLMPKRIRISLSDLARAIGKLEEEANHEKEEMKKFQELAVQMSLEMTDLAEDVFDEGLDDTTTHSH